MRRVKMQRFCEKYALFATVGIFVVLCIFAAAHAEQAPAASDLDERVSRYLNDARGTWTDLNVPHEDGKILHDLIIKANFRNILEIGTSTGHSTIWLAWAAAKTGGRVTTIEIDRERRETALKNFKAAGLSRYIDSRLGDAHKIVPSLAGPFDFVFCDADKEWYLQYFLDLKPKLTANACYTAHNVLRDGGGGAAGFMSYVKKDPGFHTSIIPGSGEGISVSCRTGK